MNDKPVLKNELDQKKVKVKLQNSISVEMDSINEGDVNDLRKPPFGRIKRQNSVFKQPFGTSLLSRQRTIQESGLSVFKEDMDRESEILSRKPSFDTYSKADIQKALEYIQSLKKIVIKRNDGDGDDPGEITIEPDDSDEVIELKEYIKELEVINKKIEAYDTYLKKKPLNYNGYNDIKVPHMSKELKKKLVEAVTKGDISEVECLLNEPDADLNMTWFSENLLMIAIRAGQESMAEYLIAIGINVSHEIELRQLKEEELPIIYYKHSCRDMAFDKGLYNIIHLIDIFSESTDDRIVKYLGAKYLERNLKNRPNPARDSDASFKSHFKKEFENIQHDDNIRDDISDKYDPAKETEYLKELDDAKPHSGYGYRLYDARSTLGDKSTTFGDDSKTVRFAVPDSNDWDELTDQSMSTASLLSVNPYNKNVVNNTAPTKARSQKLLAQNILARIKQNTQRNSSLSRNTIASTSFTSQSADTTFSNFELSKASPRVKSTVRANSRTTENNQEEIQTSRSLNSRTGLPSNYQNTPKQSTTPRKLNLKQSMELSKSLNMNDDKFYLKTNDIIKSMDDRCLLREVKKIHNHRFLSIVSQMPENKQIIESSLKKYNEPMLPLINFQDKNFEEIEHSKPTLSNCKKLPYLKKQINS